MESQTPRDLAKKCFEHTISNNILSQKNIPRFALDDVQLDKCLGNLFSLFTYFLYSLYLF